MEILAIQKNFEVPTVCQAVFWQLRIPGMNKTYKATALSYIFLLFDFLIAKTKLITENLKITQAKVEHKEYQFCFWTNHLYPNH